VVLASRRTDRLMALRAHIEAEGGDAHVVALDVTDMASIKAAVAHAETEVGPIDILINNSGVSTTQRLQDVTEDDYDFVLNTNTKGRFFVAQEVAKRMLARAKGAGPGHLGGWTHHQHRLMAGLKVLPQIGVYCMSKAAVVHMTKAMAVEWGVRHQRQRHLPGLHRHRDQPPPLADRAGPEAHQHAAAQARRSPGRPGRVLVMLASNESHFVNGAVIAADDGFGA
jgi:NAD(P)-dependent dehydrogenase (short-subunit alcohol dehydrogenase family)